MKTLLFIILFFICLHGFSYYLTKQEAFRVDPNISIDKYILKSSLPSSIEKVDKSKYILKTEIPPSVEHLDKSKYILKTEIPACPRVDMSKYIPKTQIEADYRVKYTKQRKKRNQKNKDCDFNCRESISTVDVNLEHGFSPHDPDSLLNQPYTATTKYCNYLQTDDLGNPTTWNLENNYGY